MDPNPSSFLPLFFDPDKSKNLSSTIPIYHLSLSKLPPTSDNSYTSTGFAQGTDVLGNLQAQTLM